MKSVLSCFIILLSLTQISAQQTVGLSFNIEGSYNGYTLFPTRSNMVYLIDNCGKEINSWQVSERGYGPAHLVEDGDLYKLQNNPNNTFPNAGGGAGLIERYSWDGILEWTFEYSSDTFLSHHDFTVMENGNLLVLAWLHKSAGEAQNLGVIDVPNSGIWSETIVEIKPLENNEFEIVWQWDIFDHLVQEQNPAFDNFGSIEENPQLIAINQYTDMGSDWFHFNSIDYDESLDQILVSCRNCSEVYIIDHSTTTAEAAGHLGGNAGKGGDILYRWGNDLNYLPSNTEPRKLYGQHSARWVKDHEATLGNIVIFNNGAGVPTGEFFSTAVEIRPELDDFNYQLENGAFLPEDFEWEYSADPANSFFSSRISSVQRLPNGNTLINEGGTGTFFEVNQEKQILWEYINPISQIGPIEQGNDNTSGDVFSIKRYAIDSYVFENKDLSPKEPLELNPLNYMCTLSSSSDIDLESISILNPISDQIKIWGPDDKSLDYALFNIQGMRLAKGQMKGYYEFNSAYLENGIYFLRIGLQTFKIVKQ